MAGGQYVLSGLRNANPDSRSGSVSLTMEEFYRAELKPVLESLVGKWAAMMDEDPTTFEWSILLMQKQWGSCLTAARKIQFNLLLSRVPLHCIEYIVVHEMAHLKRGDHFWKPLGFLLLMVYWFNPMVWAAYILLCRDIEMACDEKVIASLKLIV